MANNDNIRNTRKAQRATKPVVTIDWASDKAMTPYYDHENKRYAVTVTLRYETAGQNFRRAYPDEFVAEGVNKILSFYNKTLGDGITPGSIASAMDFFVPERPRAKVRVSVGIPQDKFDDPTLLQDSQFSFVGDAQATEEISINTFKLTQKIEGLSEILIDFDSQIKKADAKVHGIDLKDEASDVMGLMSVVNNLIEANGYVYSEKKSDLFSLGVDSSYNPIYAQFNQGKNFNDLTSEFGKFKNSRIVKNSQSIYYISKLDEIYGANKKVPPMNWEEFLKNFTIKNYKIELGDTRAYSPPVDDAVDRVAEEANRTPLKTSSELKTETDKFQNPFTKAKLVAARDKARSNVESGILDNLKSVENNLVGLESTYNQFLHRYQLTYIVKQAIICADPNGVIARTYAQVKQFIRDANRFVEDVIDLLKIPVITLDDLIPTIDIIGDIGKQIFLAIMDALKTALVQMLVEIVEMILSACGNPDKMNFGALKISDLLNDPTALENWAELGSELGDRALKASLSGVEAGINTYGAVARADIGGATAGIDTGLGAVGAGGLLQVGGRSGLELAASKKFISNIKGFLGNEQVQRLIDDGTLSGGEGSLKQLLNEVSAVLTPGEVSHLLTRGGTPEIKTMVQSIMSQSDSYSPAFKEMLSSDNRIEDFFTSAGKLLDEDKLLEKVAEASNLIPDDWGGLCSDDPNEELRRKLLEGKGLTQDEIDTQIQKANERRRKRLEQLQNILEKDNPLDGVMPSTYCSVDENGKVKPGLVDLDHPAFTFTLKKTIDTSMSSIYSAFNTDASGFADSLKREKKVKDREIVRTLVPPNQSEIVAYNDEQDDESQWLPIYMINPEFELYYSQGYRSPKTHPNLGSYPGPISFPAPKALEVEVLSEQTAGGTEGGAKFRQLSPDADVEHAIQQKYGEASSIFLPEIKSQVVPGLKEQLKLISDTGSATYYQAFLSDPSRPFRNFDMGDNIVKLSFETLLVQDLSSFQVVGADTDFTENLLSNVGGSLGVNSLGEVTPTRWFIRYDAQGTTGLLDEFYSINFYTINNEGREISLGNALNVVEELNPQALEVIRREDLWEPSLAGGQVSHDQFAYGPLAGGPPGNLGTQETQFSQFANKAFQEGSIIRKPEELEFYDRIGGVSNLPIISHLLQDQKIGEYRTLYIEIFRDFMTAFSSQISHSDFFNDGVIDLMNLTPKLTQRQILEDCKDPHLLDLETIKKIIENEYAITKCIDNVLSQEDGLGTSSKNALEKALLGGSVVVTIRLYALEVVLKTIFAFSEFNFSDKTEIPKLISLFIQNKIINETNKLGYSPNFIHECLESYNRVASLDTGLDVTNEREVAFDYFIRREMMTVQKKINKIIGTQTDTTINSVLSEGFIRCFDVPSGSGQLRLGIDKLESLSRQSEAERTLLRGPLSDFAINKRKQMIEPDSPYKFKAIIRNFGSDTSRVRERFYPRNAVMVEYSNVLSNQFNYTPFFAGPGGFNAQSAGGGRYTGDKVSTFDLWPEYLNPASIVTAGRPRYYDLPKIRTTAKYEINASNAGEYNNPWGGTYSFYNVETNAGNTWYQTHVYADFTYEDIGNPDEWTKSSATQNEIGWDDIVQNPWERDQAGNLVNAPPQFIAELWPLFTFTLAQKPNQHIGSNYEEIYPKFGFNDNLSQSLAPNKTGFFQIYHPSTQFSDELPDWFTEGLNNERWWKDEVSVFERDALITMFEIFNNQNILLPGNAGASYTIPNGYSFEWELGPSRLTGDPTDTTKVNESLYKLVELPSPAYSRSKLQPVLWNHHHHALTWQHGVDPWNYPKKTDDYNFYKRWVDETTSYDISVFSNDLQDLTSPSHTGLRFNSRADDRKYRIYKNSDLPSPPSAGGFLTPGGIPFLTEYSFHPKMLAYDIQDATIENFPEDIQKEIDYYENLSLMPDKELLRELRRQFTSNRNQFRLSYTQNNKLMKVGEELLQNLWNGRELPDTAVLSEMINRIYAGMQGRKLPGNQGRTGWLIWQEDITAPGPAGGIDPGHEPRGIPQLSNNFVAQSNIETTIAQEIRDAGLNLPFSGQGASNQVYPRGYQQANTTNYGLRGDVARAGFNRGYTLIYILDQIRSRLRNFRGEAEYDGESKFLYAPHTFQTYEDGPNAQDNHKPSNGVMEFDRSEETWKNPRRDKAGWIPGAGSWKSHWPPHLKEVGERQKFRFPYTNTPYWDADEALINHTVANNSTETGFELVFNEVKNNPQFYSYEDFVSSRGLEAPYDDESIFGDYQQWGTPTDNSQRIKAKYTLLLLWELDFWLNKLTAFMLLDPSFKEYRGLKDYPEFLRKIKEAARHIRSQFRKDVEWRKGEQKRIKEELGDAFNSTKPKGKLLTMFMDNGGLIYEKYIRLKEKDWQTLQDRIDHAGSMGMLDVRAALRQLDQLKRASETRDPWLKGAVNIDAFQRWLDLNGQSLQFNPALEPPQQFQTPREVIGRPEVVDDCGEGLLVTRTGEQVQVIDNNLSFNDLFEEVAYGFRVTAVASPHASQLIQEVKNDYETSFNPTNPLLPNSGNSHLRNYGGGDHKTHTLKTLVELDKAYFLHEEGEYLSGELDETTTDDPNDFITKDLIADYVTIPLVSVELPIDLNLPLSDFTGIHIIESPISSDKIELGKLRYLYNRKLPKLLSTLRETDEFKFLFKYCFPADRMFSLNLMYILLYLGQLPNVDKIFNNTKQSLKTVFNAFLNSGNYQYESDITNKNLDKYDMANPGDTPGVDLWSIAKNFSLMAFRAITELSDPNIQLSRMIYNGLESGISAANSVFGDECSATLELPPGTFFAISWGLLPINIFGAFGYGPPITPQGIVYDVIFGFVDPLATSSTKNNQRCIMKKEGGRDFTNAVECNEDVAEDDSESSTPNIPYTSDDDFAAGRVDVDGNPIPPEERPPSSMPAADESTYIDEQGRVRDRFGRVKGDPRRNDSNGSPQRTDKLYDVNGNELDPTPEDPWRRKA